jgi:hypothetical protein
VSDIKDFDGRAALAIGQDIGRHDQPPCAGRITAWSALRKVGKLLLSGSDTRAKALRGGRIALGHIGKLGIELSSSAPNENDPAGHYFAARLTSASAMI